MIKKNRPDSLEFNGSLEHNAFDNINLRDNVEATVTNTSVNLIKLSICSTVRYTMLPPAFLLTDCP